MDTKKWYLSKTIWSDILTAVIGAAMAIGTAFGVNISSIPWVGYLLGILAALGLYGRVTASTKITSA